jgi:prepilin-type N-terminal cleavage/methylation domain-containing protein
MKSYCLDQKGLSLIEVMISIVVLSFGLLGVAAMQVTAIQVNSVANKITSSSTILQDKIETLMSLPFNHADLSDVTDPGLCEEHIEPSPPTGYAVFWCVDADVNGTEKTIDLRATWLEAAKTKSFTLSFVRSIFHD